MKRDAKNKKRFVIDKKSAAAKTAALLAYTLFIVLIMYFNIPCLFKSIFGVPCPGCGMTHALISAAKLDFKGAFCQHAMFFSVPIVAALLLFPKGFFKQKTIGVLLSLIAAGFLVNWVVRLATI